MGRRSPMLIRGVVPVPDDAFIRIVAPSEQLRLNAETEKAHAEARALRARPRPDPRVEPRTLAESLRAKYAGADGPPRTVQGRTVPPARPVGRRVEVTAAPAGASGVAPQVVDGRKHRPNEQESEQLNAFRRSGRPIEICLRGGERVVGTLLRFDQYSLIVELEGVPAIVFKHAVDLVRLARVEPA